MLLSLFCCILNVRGQIISALNIRVSSLKSLSLGFANQKSRRPACACYERAFNFRLVFKAGQAALNLTLSKTPRTGILSSSWSLSNYI